MTASQRAKQIGCNSLTHVAEVTGQSLQTLGNWYKNKRAVFEACCHYTVLQNNLK